MLVVGVAFNDVLVMFVMDTASLESHILSKGRVWVPLGGFAGSDLLEHAVNLLEGKALGLRHQEVRVDERASAETSPDEEDRRPEVALVHSDHVRSDDGDDG